MELLEPEYKVLPRKQVQSPFPLLPLECYLSVLTPFFLQICKSSFILISLKAKFYHRVNSDPNQNVAWITLNTKEGRICGPVCCDSYISVQPEKEFLNRRKRKVVLC